jgi:serine/threonine protein kinase
MELCGYGIRKMLGRGGFGKVYLADAPGGVPVAIKVVDSPRGDEASQRELQALDAIKLLRHLHLLAVQAFFSMPDQLVIVMELADGSLRDSLESSRRNGQTGLPPTELIRHMKETSEALDFLHNRNMMHRDVKPENILLVAGHVKLADFGLVKVVEENRNQDRGSMSGTLAYMPPEVFRGRVHRNSDQYSLALTYIELRSGERFVSTADMVEAMLQHVEKEPDLGFFDSAEQTVLRRALHKDPDQRFPTCEAFARALEDAYSKTDIARTPPKAWRAVDTIAPSTKPKTAPTTGRPAVAKPRKSPLPMIVGGALVALLLAIGGFFAMGGFKKSGGNGNDPSGIALPKVNVGTIAAAPDSEIVTDEGRQLHSQLDLTMEDSAPIRFILVPKQRGDQNEALRVGAFYVMRDKVSFGQFRRFAAVHKPSNSQWSRGAPAGGGRFVSGDDFPLLGVLPLDAWRFADWLGGDLPSVDQWRKAAGMYEPGGRPGPFTESFKEGEVAVDRAEEGPLPLGAAAKDRSAFGLRDVAGNGKEWTHNVYPAHKGRVPLEKPAQFDRVLQVGRSYAHPEPLRFTDLDDAKVTGAPYDKPDPYCGFRVVLLMPQ